MWRQIPSSVHPHTRGEIREPIGQAYIQPGSPPHAWGDSPARSDIQPVFRFTPTRVGRLDCALHTTQGTSVHPHTRGEISSAHYRPAGDHGSPPHAWGDFHIVAFEPANQRFTPTRVGRFGPRESPRPPAPVHPHTRGEIIRCARLHQAAVGSPPHAWGDWRRRAGRGDRERFTPTRVGRLSRVRTVRVCSSVHPHTRGEIHSLAAILHGKLGSPPHAWGDYQLGKRFVGTERFTPTRVGRFLKDQSTPAVFPVHPHTRGEIDNWNPTCDCNTRDPIPCTVLDPFGGSGTVSMVAQKRFTPTRVGRFIAG